MSKENKGPRVPKPTPPPDLEKSRPLLPGEHRAPQADTRDPTIPDQPTLQDKPLPPPPPPSEDD